MAEQNVDIIDLQTFQACLHTVKDVLAIQAVLVDDADVLGSLSIIPDVFVDIFQDDIVDLQANATVSILLIAALETSGPLS